MCDTDTSGFLRDDDGNSISDFRNSQCSTMPGTEFTLNRFGGRLIIDGCGNDDIVLDDDGTIMQSCTFIEDSLNDFRSEGAINLGSRLHEIIQRSILDESDEGTDLMIAKPVHGSDNITNQCFLIIFCLRGRKNIRLEGFRKILSEDSGIDVQTDRRQNKEHAKANQRKILQIDHEHRTDIKSRKKNISYRNPQPADAIADKKRNDDDEKGTYGDISNLPGIEIDDGRVGKIQYI